jgi:tRNA 2-thiouridine synthesizing protein A
MSEADLLAGRGAVQAGPSGAAQVELDCKGLLCPLPVYRASQAVDRLEPGGVLRVECTDPGSLADFPAFARQRNLTLLTATERDGVQVFELRKGADA